MPRIDFDILDHKPIGCGQSGTVFLARRRSDGRTVALKIVLRRGESGADIVDAERHGAILQQRFATLHGMVPEVYDYDADGDDFYIAMELVDGPSLEELLRRGKLPPDAAVAHARWLCEFLERAHAFSLTVEGTPYRLLHNDLKPAHVKIAAGGERKVLDFGIAKALEETRELVTDVGRTIAYAAPERLLSERVNVHADFWSLGVMLYEMVCGHRPYPAFEGPRFRRQLYHAITSNEPRAELPVDCPRPLQAIINRLLAFQPEHRYQNATEIREDLERFQRGETPIAATFYETPATLPVARRGTPTATGNGGTPTTPVRAGLPATPTAPHATAAAITPLVTPTDPLPAGGAAASVAVLDTPATLPVARKAARRRSFLARAAAVLLMVMLISIVAREGVAWIFAERFRDNIANIDERTVTAGREAYTAVARWGPLDLGLRMRVNGRLAPALQAVGDRVISDYRREAPAMGLAEWREAYEALTWARSLSPRNTRLRAKQLIADGHVKRLTAQRPPTGTSAATLSKGALDRFREAAEVDDRSFDPYLGMAVTQVYALGDVDGAAASIDEAVRRGYTSTRRETALLGDGHMRRGLVTRRRAQLLTGEQRRRELLKARSDFERSVAFFEQIVEFGKAAAHLETCKAHIQRIDRQLLEDEI